MKKKAIEKIAFLGLPKTSRKKDAKFIGRTAIKIVDHEQHFFLEVYKNNKAHREVPVVRIVVTKKDFGTYFPAEGRWSRAKIRSDEYRTVLIWGDKSIDGQMMRNRNILHSPDDMERIKRFFKDTKIWIEENWWEYINLAEDHIACEERNKTRARKYERRQQALQDRIDNTPKLPEQEILSWADKNLFKTKHFLYYKKKGSRATICCSACGGVSEGRWRAGDTYESQFEKRIMPHRTLSVR